MNAIVAAGGLSRETAGYCESFNGKLRDELLNGEVFYSLKEAQIVIEKWRKHYNTVRPQIGAAVHLAFHEFELRDLIFGLTVRPTLHKGRADTQQKLCV